MYVSDFQDSAGNQLLLIFICQLALDSLKEVPDGPSGPSIRRLLVVLVIFNLWYPGDTNSPQLVDNLSEADKDSLHFMRCKVSRSTHSLEKSFQLVGTTLTNGREWDNWMIHMDLMITEQITEVQWQICMKFLTLKIIKEGKLIKILNNANQPFVLQLNEL